MTTTDVGLMPLVLQLGRARAAMMDVPAVLLSVCSALPGALGVSGAVLLLVDPSDGVSPLSASDARARWFGEAQQRAGVGPLPGAVRTWRPTLTNDLSRVGHPSVAAAATECGLSSSLVLPFDVDGDRLGVLQLLGEASRPVAAAHAEALRPLLDTLAARLADVRALHRARRRTEGAVASSVASPVAPPAAAPAAVPTPRSADGERAAPTPGRRRATAGRSVESSGSSPARRARGGRVVPSTAEDASPSESTTRALPAVPSGRRRTGRHSA